VSNTSNLPGRVERTAVLGWVPIERMRVSPLAQRELNPARVNKILMNFDVEQLGALTVNDRNKSWYVIDGQHRVEALRAMGWGDQQVQCWKYAGLSEAEEAEMFLKLNDVLAVGAFAKFKVGIQAGREMQCEINRIVTREGLKVAQDKSAGSISATGTLSRVYQQTGAENLGHTLRVVRDTYGDIGLSSAVIDGIALLLHRYGDQIDDAQLITRLSSVNGGLNALLNTAARNHQRYGAQKRHCVAAAAVELLNGGRGGKKLPSWWREDDGHTTRRPRLRAVGE
jgi:uncharacterized protein DUF6551